MNPDARIACKIISLLLAVVSIIGNTLVCHVIVRLKTMKTSINYIILNLAILDAIVGIFILFHLFVFDVHSTFIKFVLPQAYDASSSLADAICKVKWILWLPVNVAPLLLMLMAYERFKAIVHPFSRLDGTVTKARLKWLLPLIWATGAVYILFDIVMFKYDHNSKYCMYVNVPKWYEHKILVATYQITQNLIPATSILVFYGRVICALKRQDNALGPQAEAGDRHENRKKVMWVVVAVTLVFYICCGIPQTLYALEIFYGRDKLSLDFALDIKILLITINSAFNPFAYFFFMQSFRDGFKRLFTSRQRINLPNNPLQMERVTHNSTE